MSADGRWIAFASAGDLDPAGPGNAAHVAQIFMYDVANHSFHQLTQFAADSCSFKLAPGIAFNPSGTILAGAEEIPFACAVPEPPQQHAVFTVDIATAVDTPVFSTTYTGGGVDSQLQFSSDGTQLFFTAPVLPDSLFPAFNPPFEDPGALFRYSFADGTAYKLIGFGSDFAVAADGRLAVNSSPNCNVDPEGTNSVQAGQIFLVDPQTGGGFLALHNGKITQATNGNDRFTLKGKFIQPSGVPLDAGSVEVALSVLSANGQIFRATLPAGAMVPTGSGWRYANAGAANLMRLAIGTADHIHYTFTASGGGANLFLSSTPSLTVEIQIGSAVFSNAQVFRLRHHMFVYP